jgi:integrase
MSESAVPWEFIVDVGAHPVTGRRRRKSRSGFATKKEAESALHEVIRLVEGGGDPCPERIRLGDFLVRWLGYQRARGVRSLTLETYEGYIRREIAPVIGGLEIARIQPGHVRAVLARMQGRGLSAATIAQARGVLGSALRQAVEEGLIPSNPVTAVKRPRIRRRELHWPTPEQLTALLHASMGTIWEIPLLLSMVTGARRSEILGLAWHDVDLRSATIRICRGVQRMPDRDPAGPIAFTALKTKRARRVIQLPAFTLQRIGKYRREQLERRALLGSGWQDPPDDEGVPVALVCERGDGSFIHPDSFTHAFKRFGRQVGLHPSTRLHDVRHAVATELGRQGCMGWSFPRCSAMRRRRSPSRSTSTRGKKGPARQPLRWRRRSLPTSPALAIRWQMKISMRPTNARPSRISRSQKWVARESNPEPTD